jgi:hypothetical protein
MDEDSDVDMYVYESDPDESYTSNNRRKRKRPASSHKPLKEDASTRVVERPIRLQKLVNETYGLQGLFGDFPIKRESTSFSLPPGWTCRRQRVDTTEDKTDENEQDLEFEELLSLQRLVEESDSVGLRRSTRSHDTHEASGKDASGVGPDVEYVPVNPLMPSLIETFPTNRHELELERERLHEESFAKLWRNHHKVLVLKPSEEFGADVGMFSDASFPPFLGRVVPVAGLEHDRVWEIREPFIATALRWVIRGLIRSEHLSESEPLSTDSLTSGSILPNNIFTISDSDPFEEIDLKVLARRKRADQEVESSEEEVEMSEYEKLRAARVARNEERLRELGLL